VVGAVCAAIWGVVGWFIGGQADRKAAVQSAPGRSR